MIKAAVLGSPISHSLSPLLHTLAYGELGVDGEYSRIDMKADGLINFLSNLEESWSGFSLTMPLKEEVLNFTCDVSDLSLRINSANTLTRDGKDWKATTTDVSGLTHALAAAGINATGHVLIIGGGATARSAIAACDGVADRITIMNRSLSRVEAIKQSAIKSEIGFVSLSDFQLLEVADLIISTTPAGVTDHLIVNFPTKPAGVFFDVLYNPWPTPALAAWERAGGQIVDGLELLIHQAIDQISIFSGLIFERQPMAELMRRHALKALHSST